MSGYFDEYKELRTLIAENPELPLMFMASDECGNPDWAWSVASAKAKKGILLDTEGPNIEKIYQAEDELEEDVQEKIGDENPNWTGLQIEEAAKEEIKKYIDKWIDVIYVYIEAY